MAVLAATCVLVGMVINGTINFSYDSAANQTDVDGTLLTSQAALSPHGFHVHTSGNLSDAEGTCKLTGGHYNPQGVNHGAPTDAIRHAGDLGNVNVTADGKIVLQITDSHIPLEGDFSVAGRAIVIHALIDDLGKGGDEGSLKTGNAGARLNCCTITATATPSTAAPSAAASTAAPTVPSTAAPTKAPTAAPATVAPTADSAGYTIMVSKSTVISSILLAITCTAKFMF